jgi:hypothetical protein
MQMRKKITLIAAFCSHFMLNAQTTLVNQGNIVVNNDVNIVLENTNWQNDGTFTATDGTVTLKGNATQSNSSIGGANATTFHKLTINKSSNNAQLGQMTTITNQLTLTQGKLSLENYDLTMGSNAGIVSSTNYYIQTSGTGRLGRTVSNGGTNFPIGKNTYTPMYLVNSGMSDILYVRVDNQVLKEGTSGAIITNDVVNATWFVDENVVGGSDVTMTVTWSDTDELSNFNGTACYISHYNNGAWDTQLSSVASGTNPFSLSRSGITSFSPFSVVSNAGVLPLTLLDFEGKNISANENLLTWKTSNEENFSHFELERSNDATHFSFVGKIESNPKSIYQYTDNQFFTGKNYYRLKMVDKDGRFEYSNVIFLENKNKVKSLSVYPNPSNGILHIVTSNENSKLLIFNEIGILVRSYDSVLNKIDLSDLPSGVYFIMNEGEKLKWIKV